jgi:hypothetical protein
MSSTRIIPPIEASSIKEPRKDRKKPPLASGKGSKKDVPNDNSFLFMDQSSINLNVSNNNSKIIDRSLFEKSSHNKYPKQDVSFDDTPDENAGFKYNNKYSKSPVPNNSDRPPKRKEKSHQPFKELPASKN